MSGMCITPEQEAILNSFTCQRLTADPENMNHLNSFRCGRNRNLANKLKNEAWFEDTDGIPAVYYVVKDAEGQIALYFSLKCGTLCDVAYVNKVLEEYEEVKKLVDRLEKEREEYWTDYELDRLRRTGVPSYGDRMEEFEEYWALKAIKYEKKREPNDKLIRVDQSFPAVELVHFCANDRYRDKWKSLNLGHSMGEVFFWKFVIPQILEISKLVGCEYVYLFAAENGYANKLIDYYKDVLHFELHENISGIKPRYDYECIFMCKRLYSLSWFRRQYVDQALYEKEDTLGLTDYAELFFENFNKT